MKSILTAYLILLGSLASHAAESIQISDFSTNGDFSASISRAYWAIEWCADVNGTWLPTEFWNMPVTGSNARVALPISDIRTNHGYFRAICSWNIIHPPTGPAVFNTDTNGWGRVTGKVMFWEGDFMPGQPTGTITPVIRTLCFFEKTSNVVHVGYPWGSFYSFVLSPFAGSTKSNASGNFSIGLPPGDYSVFVLEKPDGEFGEEYYHASVTDGGGYIHPVKVVINSNTVKQIDIHYLATY